MSEFPKMLYRGDEQCVVADPEAEAVKLREGYVTAADYYAPKVAEAVYPSDEDVVDAPKKRGRPKKSDSVN